MKKLIFTLAALICGLSLFGGTPTQDLLERLNQESPMAGSIMGVYAVRAGQTIVEYNSNLRLVPASNLKLVTTGTAIHKLGADYRFSTGIAYDGEISGGILDGDIYIIGGADPTLGASYEGTPSLEETFAQWKAMLDKAGIRTVHGDILADVSWLDGRNVHDSWNIDDLCYEYGAVPEGLNIRRNWFDLKVTNGASEGDKIEVESPYPWYTVNSEAVASPAKSGYDLISWSTDFTPEIRVEGSLGVDRSSTTLEATNRFGARSCAYEFQQYLCQNGIPVSGEARAQDFKYDVTMLGHTYSVPMKQIIADCNGVSDNFYAETLLRTLGREMTGSACYDSSNVARKRVLEEMGVEKIADCKLRDGSGLARSNNITPAFLVSFLQAMEKSPAFNEYYASLPIAGKTGTMKNRMRNAPQGIRYRVHAKTGSVGGVRSASGYIDAPDGDPGKRIVFSIILNNMVEEGLGTSVIDKIIESIAKE